MTARTDSTSEARTDSTSDARTGRAPRTGPNAPRTPVRRPAPTPDALHGILEDAFNRGDLDAYVDAHDEDATVAVPPDGRVARGHDEIRSAAAPIFALRPRVSIVVLGELAGPDLAVTWGGWGLVGTDPDGNPAELSGRGTMVSRRRPDGTWRIVLDQPLSPLDQPLSPTERAGGIPS
jgi:uncharacterized protein (TIGR02246 family)